MSTQDEQVKTASTEDADESRPEVTAQTTADEGKDGPGGMIILFFILGFVASLIVGWVVYPALLYSKKNQPIDFNHRLHVEMVDEGCDSCHYFREDGTFSGIPKLAECIDCHEEVQGEDPNEVKFVEEYVMEGKEVPWLVYARQPDCVFFSHAAHVLAGGMDCVTCHGHIGDSTHSRVYEENRVTGYSRDIWGKNISGFKRNSWDRMKMDDCDQCHMQQPGRTSSVQTRRDACFVCHK